MTEYDIPLHPYEEDEEKAGIHVLVQGNTIRLIDYSTKTPHDLISLQRWEALRLVELLTVWLASETKIYSLFTDRYGEYKNED